MSKLIKQTTDYDQFKNIVGNRSIYKEHLNELKKEIERNNLLSVQPIIVNEKKEIIDGQHRLEAAKMLGLPIYYIVVPGLNIEHLVRLNNTQKRWKMMDYVELHCALGNPQYIYLRDFMKYNKLSLSNAVLLVSSWGNMTTGSHAFKEGRYQIKSIEEGQEIFDQVMKIHGNFRTPGIFSHDSFWGAIKRTARILERENIPFSMFIDAVISQGAVIEWYSQVGFYARDFEDILRKAKIKVRLI